MERRPKVLVIEDDRDMVEALRSTLEMASYEVIVAYGGQEGVEKTRQERPDVIILDLMMPEKDGFVVCQELKSDPECADIPILVLTSIADHLYHTRYAQSMGLMLEAEDYIDKPVQAQQLVQRLNQLLARQRA
ncbi:MAG TPA: response regulator [Armatimonadetes bacterium]|nr:response regulator [Armatimonadota bacterium]